MDLVATSASTFRMLICPEPSSAQTIITAVSADAGAVLALIRQLHSSCDAESGGNILAANLIAAGCGDANTIVELFGWLAAAFSSSGDRAIWPAGEPMNSLSVARR
jgi:hypothetical protein